MRKQKWMTNEILDLMTERSKYRRDSHKYKEADKKIKLKCKEAKEKYMNDQCEELYNLQKKTISLLYNKLRTMHKRKTRAANKAIKNKSGKIMFEKEDIKQRWVEYGEELCDDLRPDRPADNPELEGHSILESEVKAALRSMKSNKAPGNDNITKEMIEACGGIGSSKMVKILNKIYESGYIPQQMKESIFIPIPKKGDLPYCSNYHLISLMSHITKLLIHILMFRMKKAINNEINWEQFGFRKNKGTRNAIFVMRSITKRSIQMQQDVYAAFIDYEKAVDRVKHIEIMKDLKEIGINGKDIRVIKNLYWEQMAAISIDDELSEWTHIKRGVRQGCVISPDLFSQYTEVIMRKVK